MLVINPEECIDCGVCEPECPVDAIHPDSDEGMERWVEINGKYSEFWPNITKMKKPPEDSEKWENVPMTFYEKRWYIPRRCLYYNFLSFLSRTLRH